MRQFIVITLVVGTLATLGIPASVSAHEFKADGAIGALYHTNPNDDPVAYEPAELLFAFKDEQERFGVEQCRCAIEIRKGDRVMYRAAMDSVAASEYGSNVLIVPFVFPGRGLYTVAISGEARNGSFSPFQISYSRRVERVSDSATWYEKLDERTRTALMLVTGGVLLFVVGMVTVNVTNYIWPKKYSRSRR